MEGQKPKKERTESEKRIIAARKKLNMAIHDLIEATIDRKAENDKKPKKQKTATEEPKGPFACAGDVVSGTPCDQGRGAVPAKSATRHNGTNHQTCTSCKKKIKAARLLIK